MSIDHEKINAAIASKEQMIAIVSHDIKNPLSAIQLEAQMLLKAAEKSQDSLLADEVRIQAGRILKTTKRLKILISDLLDKNKTENGLTKISRESVDLNRLTQEVLDSMRVLIQEKNIILKTTLPLETLVSVDRNKMFQVICNLLSNAIKFTPPGGTIDLFLEENTDEVHFIIEDSGPGLSGKEINRIFEKYWSGGVTEGTGLGLFICKTITEAHGGHIYVENKPQQSGARFKLSLPKNVPLGKRSSYPGDDRKKIYVIDDDEDLREVISWAFGKEGYAVHGFHSPKEALDCLLKGQHTPHLVLVDYQMDEMKGCEFLKKMKTIGSAKDCPVFMITGSPDEVSRDIAHPLYQDLISKPIDLEGLIKRTAKYLKT